MLITHWWALLGISPRSVIVVIFVGQGSRMRGCVMSINTTLTAPAFGGLLARARDEHEGSGCRGEELRRCMEYTMRYLLQVPTATVLPPAFFTAIQAIAAKQLPDAIAGRRACPTGDLHGAVRAAAGEGSVQYWTGKVAGTLGMTAWTDDSLETWYLDASHPLMDVIVQASRRRLLDRMLAGALAGEAVDGAGLVDAITTDLLARVPSLGRFRRHLPAAITSIIETDVLGMPLDEARTPLLPAARDSLATTHLANDPAPVDEAHQAYTQHATWRMEHA